MKTTALLFGIFLSLATSLTYAQDRTTVTANSTDISDNLDLRAIAYVFGESNDLEDFENRLNDPSLKLSNLDLNYDNQVDYMRVIESVEDYTHLIIIQAVVGRDSFQDIATIEVEKNRRNRNVQVQIVGNVFLYGSNYIYEPVYYTSPVIYRHFWVPNYVAYYSPWAWSYYPTYYYAWNPCAAYSYHNHVYQYVNMNNSCYYTNYRRSNRAVAMHHSRRGNAYEKQYPNRSFSQRNTNVSNRHELAQTRGKSSNEGRTATAARSRDLNSKSTVQTRGTQSVKTNDRSTVTTNSTRGQNSVKGTKQSIDRSLATTSRSTNGAKATSYDTRASQTKTMGKSSSSVDRSNSKPSRGSDTAMNQSRSSKPTVSSDSPSRSNSSSATRSTNSSQRSSGGNSGNTNSRGGGRS